MLPILPPEPSSSVVMYQIIQIHCAGCTYLEAINKIPSEWCPHHHKGARRCASFKTKSILKVATFCVSNIATLATFCVSNVATVDAFCVLKVATVATFNPISHGV